MCSHLIDFDSVTFLRHATTSKQKKFSKNANTSYKLCGLTIFLVNGVDYFFFAVVAHTSPMSCLLDFASDACLAPTEICLEFKSLSDCKKQGHMGWQMYALKDFMLLREGIPK